MGGAPAAARKGGAGGAGGGGGRGRKLNKHKDWEPEFKEADWEVKARLEAERVVELEAQRVEEERLAQIAAAKARSEGSWRVNAQVGLELPSRSSGIFPLGRSARVRFIFVPQGSYVRNGKVVDKDYVSPRKEEVAVDEEENEEKVIMSDGAEGSVPMSAQRATRPTRAPREDDPIAQYMRELEMKAIQKERAAVLLQAHARRLAVREGRQTSAICIQKHERRRAAIATKARLAAETEAEKLLEAKRLADEQQKESWFGRAASWFGKSKVEASPSAIANAASSSSSSSSSSSFCSSSSSSAVTSTTAQPTRMQVVAKHVGVLSSADAHASVFAAATRGAERRFSREVQLKSVKFSTKKPTVSKPETPPRPEPPPHLKSPMDIYRWRKGLLSSWGTELPQLPPELARDPGNMSFRHIVQVLLEHGVEQSLEFLTACTKQELLKIANEHGIDLRSAPQVGLDPNHEVQFSAPLQLQHSTGHMRERHASFKYRDGLSKMRANAGSTVLEAANFAEFHEGKRPLLRRTHTRNTIVWTSQRQKALERHQENMRKVAALRMQRAYHARKSRLQRQAEREIMHAKMAVMIQIAWRRYRWRSKEMLSFEDMIYMARRKKYEEFCKGILMGWVDDVVLISRRTQAAKAIDNLISALDIGELVAPPAGGGAVADAAGMEVGLASAGAASTRPTPAAATSQGQRTAGAGRATAAHGGDAQGSRPLAKGEKGRSPQRRKEWTATGIEEGGGEGTLGYEPEVEVVRGAAASRGDRAAGGRGGGPSSRFMPPHAAEDFRSPSRSPPLPREDPPLRRSMESPARGGRTESVVSSTEDSPARHSQVRRSKESIASSRAGQEEEAATEEATEEGGEGGRSLRLSREEIEAELQEERQRQAERNAALRGLVRTLAKQWFEYLEEHPEIGGRLEGGDDVMPTWKDVARWAMWLLRNARPQLASNEQLRAKQTTTVGMLAIASPPVATPPEASLPSAPAPAASELDTFSPYRTSQQQFHRRYSQESVDSEAPAPAPAPAPSRTATLALPADESLNLSLYNAAARMAFMPGEPRGDKNRQVVEAWLNAAQLHVFPALYPAMAAMAAGDRRLYWTRVVKSFAGHFSDKGRAAWAEAAAAGARTAAVRQGKRTPRQHAAATSAIKSVEAELKPRLPRSARGPGGKRLQPPTPTPGPGGTAFGVGAPKPALGSRHVRTPSLAWG